MEEVYPTEDAAATTVQLVEGDDLAFDPAEEATFTVVPAGGSPGMSAN